MVQEQERQENEGTLTMKCDTAAKAARAEVEGTSAKQEGASHAAETEKVCKDQRSMCGAKGSF